MNQKYFRLRHGRIGPVATRGRLNEIVSGLLFACFTGIISSALWAGYDRWHGTGDFLKQLEAEVRQNAILEKEFKQRSESENRETKYVPLYPNQLPTSVRDMLWPVYKDKLSYQTITEVDSFYERIDSQRETVSRIWQSAVSGQLDTAAQLMGAATEQQQDIIDSEAAVLLDLMVERSKISYICLYGKCLIHP